MTKRNSTVFTLAFALFALVQGVWATTQTITLRNDSETPQTINLTSDIDLVTVDIYTSDPNCCDVTLKAPEGSIYRIWGKVNQGYLAIDNVGSYAKGEFGTDSYVWHTQNNINFWPTLDEDGGLASIDVLFQVLNPSHVVNESQLNKIKDLDLPITLTGDIQLTKAITVTNGQNVTIDLNGHTISRSLTEVSEDGQVINVEQGGTLTITDGSANHTGKITGGKAIHGAGIYNLGTTTLNNVTVTGNTSSENGAGIYNYGTLTLNGGTVTSNNATDNNASGGGIYHRGGSLTLNGLLTISGNTGNTFGTVRAEDVYLSASNKITVGELASGSSIGLIRSAGYNNEYTSGFATNNPGAKPSDFFFCDGERRGADFNGNEVSCYDEVQYVDIDSSLKSAFATKLSDIADVNGVTLKAGWYYVDKERTFNNRIYTEGTVHIITTEFGDFNALKGIGVPEGSTLHIWERNLDVAMSFFNVGQYYDNKWITTIDNGYAAIGGEPEIFGGVINIHGGVIEAVAKAGAPAIGKCDSVTITGGLVVAGPDVDYYKETNDRWGGAGIGGDATGLAPDITITGGWILASGGNNAAGIGSGAHGFNHVPRSEYSHGPENNESYKTIRISGGTVSAYGGPMGAGIGGGGVVNESGDYRGLAGNIIISGGTIDAHANDNKFSEFCAEAIGHGGLRNGQSIVHGTYFIYDNAKVSATNDINGHNYEVFTGDGRYNAWTHINVKIEPKIVNSGAVTVDRYYLGSDRTAAIIDGNYKGEGVVDFPTDVDVDTAIFNRTFTVGKYSTIVLPFGIAANKVVGADFYKILGIVKEGDQWKTVQITPAGDNLIANTPYLLNPTATALTFKGTVTLNTYRKNPYEFTQDGVRWEFRGAYEYFAFSDSTQLLTKTKRAYAFAANDENDLIKVGSFAKVNSSAKVPALRAYLVYNEVDATPNSGPAPTLAKSARYYAPQASVVAELPETLDVEIVNPDGGTTVIGTLNTVTGEIRMAPRSADRWFDIQGRVLNGKPTIKGRYLHNGKIEVIK